MKNILPALLLTTLLFLLSACNPVPERYTRISSHALKNYHTTDIARSLEKEVKRHPGRSGFEVVRYGREAFTARIAMTDLTEKTLDLQYYLWDPDETGRLLALHTLKAADRGVKVRILLDDIGLQGRDSMIAAMDVHPNIEIRIFNPFSHRKLHFLDFMTDTQRVNHRMHNKTVIMDNAFTMLGGRNIGNHYFGVSKEVNFRDMDIAAVGPIVRDVSKMYDHFWNGRWSVPISAITQKTYTMKDLEKVRKKLHKRSKKDRYPYPLAQDSRSLQQQLHILLKRFVWTKGEVLYNDPEQMKRAREEQTHTMLSGLHERMKHLKRSLYVESAYFIPGEKGVARLTALRKKGVKIRILTNSMKSNDVLAAYAGYEHYREALLRHGIDIYELRADAGAGHIINHEPADAKVRTGLHAKIIVFDEKDIFIGSFNLDPRSSEINTEGGLYIESPLLAKRVLAYMNEGIEARNAYRLELDKAGHIVWVTEEKGKKRVYTSEPKVTAWDRLKVDLLQLLPLEDQL